MNILKLKSSAQNICTYIELFSTTILKPISTLLLIFIIAISPNLIAFSQQSLTTTCGNFTNVLPLPKGIKGKINTVKVPLGNNASGAIIECICRYRYTQDGKCPASITYSMQNPNGSISQIAAHAKAINIGDDPDYPSYIYRLNYNSAVTSVTYNPPSSGYKSMRSMVVWKKSESLQPNLPNLYEVDRFFFNRFDSDDSFGFYKIKVPALNKSRNFTTEIPVADHENKGGKVAYNLIAYNGNEAFKQTGWIIRDDNNLESDIRIDKLTFNNIGKEVTHIGVVIKSVSQGHIVGASLIVGSILVKSKPCCTPNITCPANFERPTDAGSCTYIVKGKELDPTIKAGCAAKLTNSYNGKATLAGTTLPKGKTTITWTASGGLDNCTVSITVTENKTCSPNTCFFEYVYDSNACSCTEKPIEMLCDDNNECTKDYVDSESCECVHEPIENNSCACNVADWKALKAIYESTNGRNWNSFRQQGWDQVWGDSPPANCDLSKIRGVTLNSEKRVVALNLFSIDELKGPFPIEVGNLSELKYLYMAGVDFMESGIPPEIGKLSNLIELILSASNIGGVLPVELAELSNLTLVIIRDNEINGCYPNEYKVFCDQLTHTRFRGNPDFSVGNNFNANWEDFCETDEGVCNNFRLSSSDFSVYPNPSKGIVSVKFENDSDQKRTIYVYDISGKHYETISQNGNNNSVELNLSKLPKGIYIIEVQTNQNTQTQKLILH